MTGSPTISVITPTCGRPTLEMTIKSVAPQLLEGDEHIIVHDGWSGVLPEIPQHHGRYVLDSTRERTTNNGGAQRDKAMALARGDYLMFIDDDDVFMGHALATARAGILKYPDRPLVYQMMYGGNHAVLWGSPAVLVCNVGTPMFVVPNTPRLPTWSEFDKNVNVHDFMWIAEVCKQFKFSPMFIETVISLIRPTKDDLFNIGLCT